MTAAYVGFVASKWIELAFQCTLSRDGEDSATILTGEQLSSMTCVTAREFVDFGIMTLAAPFDKRGEAREVLLDLVERFQRPGMPVSRMRVLLRDALQQAKRSGAWEGCDVGWSAELVDSAILFAKREDTRLLAIALSRYRDGVHPRNTCRITADSLTPAAIQILTRVVNTFLMSKFTAIEASWLRANQGHTRLKGSLSQRISALEQALCIQPETGLGVGDHVTENLPLRLGRLAHEVHTTLHLHNHNSPFFPQADLVDLETNRDDSNDAMGLAKCDAANATPPRLENVHMEIEFTASKKRRRISLENTEKDPVRVNLSAHGKWHGLEALITGQRHHGPDIVRRTRRGVVLQARQADRDPVVRVIHTLSTHNHCCDTKGGDPAAVSTAATGKGLLCIVCETNPRDTVLQPCGHFVVCEECSVRVGKACPICRQSIEYQVPCLCA